jgi:hypothetical protein
MTAKLNLGCGEFKKEGYINLDNSPQTKPDIVHDLNLIPYPFPDNSMERVFAEHVLEHLDRPFAVMKEIHRICQPGAIVEIKVPHFSRGMSHPEHCHGFDVTFPLYFQKSFQGGFQGVAFKHRLTRLRWMSQWSLRKSLVGLTPSLILAFGAGLILNLLARLSPYLCSRLWCFWVGGFEEIEFQLEVIKSP